MLWRSEARKSKTEGQQQGLSVLGKVLVMMVLISSLVEIVAVLVDPVLVQVGREDFYVSAADEIADIELGAPVVVEGGCMTLCLNSGRCGSEGVDGELVLGVLVVHCHHYGLQSLKQMVCVLGWRYTVHHKVEAGHTSLCDFSDPARCIIINFALDEKHNDSASGRSCLRPVMRSLDIFAKEPDLYQGFPALSLDDGLVLLTVRKLHILDE